VYKRPASASLGEPVGQEKASSKTGRQQADPAGGQNKKTKRKKPPDSESPNVSTLLRQAVVSGVARGERAKGGLGAHLVMARTASAW
jgi:hypothetical protein